MEAVTGGERLPGPADPGSPAWRWLAFSAGVAAWCTAWIWGLLAITRPFPGIISSRAGIGALELLEIPTGRSYPLVLVAIFLLCLLPPLLVGMLRNFLDSDREAVATLLWPLRSRGFVLASIAWTIAGVCWVVYWMKATGYDRSGMWH